MGKINILQPNVFNMIAAGEVVERPASVVKELTENAIDAGATAIDIFIEEGGIRRIQVSDNGVGIDGDDLRAAFEPHATSKLSSISDLDTISTLGFRGEALASIASVSEVTLISRARGAAQANKITLSAGKVVSEAPDSRVEGTFIDVSNLFFNTPARLKFLKKPASEQRMICDIVEKIAFANPTIAITLATEDEILLEQEAGGTLFDSLMSLYGVADADRMIEVNRTSSSGISIRGYTSNADFTASTRSRQTVIVNGRVVENSTVTTAVEKAYQDILMKRNYPVFVLDVVVPFEDVDVNVHPSKTEVRFRNKNAVFGAVFRAVEEALKASNPFEFDVSDRKAEAPASESYSQLRLDTAGLTRPVKRPPDGGLRLDFPWKIDSVTVAAEAQTPPYSLPIARGSAIDEAASDLTTDNTESKDLTQSSPSPAFDGKIVGQLFSTYLIVERDGVAYIIDQHAAHERILYDKLMSQLSNDYSQSLIIPYKIKPVGEEIDYFEKILPSLNQMGFEICKKPDYYLVFAVPMLLANTDIKKLMGELFKNMLDDGEVKVSELMKDCVAKQACKMAIKGGDALNPQQIEQVIASFISENGALPARCPHGRPAVVALDRREFEKLFKRIVP